MKLKNICLILSIVFLAIGLGTMFMSQSWKMDIIQGGSKGLAGVFFILYYILMLLGKQPTDKTGAEHY